MTPLDRIRRARAEGLRPDAQLRVSEWADAYRRLPQKSSAEPGPWRTARTPYLGEILDCLSTTSPVEEVVFMKAAQIGGTEVLLNTMGYVIDHAPGPLIVVQPTVELAKRFSRQRVDPLTTDTPQLMEKIGSGSGIGARDSGNTILSKDFPGGVLIITGANSAVGLRSMPAQYALLDEIDGYPMDVDEEGSPIDLVEARQRTFARRKRLKISTPTIAGRSMIEEAYANSDQRQYLIACPDCGHEQPLEFSQLTWSRLGLLPQQAVYVCRACEYAMREHQKTHLLQGGRWVPRFPDRPVRGYFLNALYAPVGWFSWGQIAEMFVRVHKQPEKFRVFVNTVLGLPWTSKGEAPAWERLRDRRATYAIGTVPAEVGLLTAGVDVQKDRVVYEIVGWGEGKRSWSIDAGEIPGDTADLEHGPWAGVDALLDRVFTRVDGAEFRVRYLAVDSGYNTQQVYTWTKRHPISRVAAVKGYDYGGLLVGSPTPVEILINGKKAKRGGRVFPVCTPIAKEEFYGWLRLERAEDGSTPPGYCTYPQYDDELFKQWTSEQTVLRKNRKGFIRYEWEILPGRQNHYLDARVYARAAAALAGMDRLTEAEWRRLVGGTVVRPTPAPTHAPLDSGTTLARGTPSEPPRSTSARPTSSFLGRRPRGWFAR